MNPLLTLGPDPVGVGSPKPQGARPCPQAVVPPPQVAVRWCPLLPLLRVIYGSDAGVCLKSAWGSIQPAPSSAIIGHRKSAEERVITSRFTRQQEHGTSQREEMKPFTCVVIYELSGHAPPPPRALTSAFRLCPPAPAGRGGTSGL